MKVEAYPLTGYLPILLSQILPTPTASKFPVATACHLGHQVGRCSGNTRPGNVLGERHLIVGKGGVCPSRFYEFATNQGCPLSTPPHTLSDTCPSRRNFNPGSPTQVPTSSILVSTPPAFPPLPCPLRLRTFCPTYSLNSPPPTCSA